MKTNEANDINNPLEYGDSIISSIKDKADRYKRWTRIATWCAAVFGAFTPVVLSISDVITIEWAKGIASVFGALSALIPTIVGLEKPHERWRLYRRYHRLLANERANYLNGIEPYNDSETKDSRYFKMLANQQMRLHEEWEGVVVTHDEIKNGTN